MNVDNGELFADFVVFDEDATLTLRVAPGNYHIMGSVFAEDFETTSMVGDPEVRVTGATSFSLTSGASSVTYTGASTGLLNDPANLAATVRDESGTPIGARSIPPLMPPSVRP